MIAPHVIVIIEHDDRLGWQRLKVVQDSCVALDRGFDFSIYRLEVQVEFVTDPGQEARCTGLRYASRDREVGMLPLSNERKRGNNPRNVRAKRPND